MRIAVDVVVVFVGVYDLGDLPTARARRIQAFFIIQRVDGNRFAAAFAGEQIVKIAQ